MDVLLVDGSNVARYGGARPADYGLLLHVVAEAEARGWFVRVIVDPSLRHRLRPEDAVDLEERLWDAWEQTPKGVPADQMLLEEARRLGAPIVSNDRFRDHDARGITCYRFTQDGVQWPA